MIVVKKEFKLQFPHAFRPIPKPEASDSEYQQS